jgi:hypothetical protein
MNITSKSLLQKLNKHLGLKDQENLNSNNRLEGWTKYEHIHDNGRNYGYDYLIGMIEHWLGSEKIDTKYTILNLTREKPEIEGLEFFELMNLIKENWDWGGFMSIYSNNYEKIIHVNDFGYYWKNF